MLDTVPMHPASPDELDDVKNHEAVNGIDELKIGSIREKVRLHCNTHCAPICPANSTRISFHTII